MWLAEEQETWPLAASQEPMNITLSCIMSMWARLLLFKCIFWGLFLNILVLQNSCALGDYTLRWQGWGKPLSSLISLSNRSTWSSTEHLRSTAWPLIIATNYTSHKGYYCWISSADTPEKYQPWPEEFYFEWEGGGFEPPVPPGYGPAWPWKF